MSSSPPSVAPSPPDQQLSAGGGGGRVLVFVVAYDAERHIEAVLERLPAELFNHPRFHLLIIDDSSRDRSAVTAAAWLRQRRVENATVMRNPENQGYGGNQKLGYRFALDRGFDFVILLHGDGQYDPALVSEFVAEFDRSGADVVLGSRMESVRSAARGGMPLYKIVGNRVLTWLQNRLTGRRLSEYHTGYRGYSRAFLSRIPFEVNTNDFHFDTEILLQAFHVGARLVEFPIPTHYGDEVCHVDGLRYATNVTRATLRYRLHSLGLHCSLKFRDRGPARYRSKVWVPYSSHSRAIARVRASDTRILLDLGCGAGYVAAECERLGVRVTGVDREPPAETVTMSRFIHWDLEQSGMPVSIWSYDTVLLLDVIEHLADPEAFLVGLRHGGEGDRALEAAPKIILTTPNIAFLAVRLGLLLGRFSYAERGILDITHKRLFTRASLLSMLDDCGFEVEAVEGIGVPFEAVVGGRLGSALGRAADFLARLWPSLLAFQLLVVSRPRAGVERLLRASESVFGEASATAREAGGGGGRSRTVG